MIIRKLACVAAAALAASAAAPASAASFIGDNVVIKRIQGGNVFKTANSSVGSGFEYTDNFFGIDITANQVTFEAIAGNFRLGDISYEISGLDFDDNPATPNVIEDFAVSQFFTSQNVLIGADRAMISETGLFRMSLNQVTGGGSGFATITFGAAPLQSAVPEPATWAMMIGGFGLVGGAMRSARRRRHGGLAYSR